MVFLLTVGLIQFMYSGGLPSLAARIKIECPKVWADYFHRYGIDLEVNRGATVGRIGPIRIKSVVRKAAGEYFRDDKQLSARWVIACRQPDDNGFKSPKH